MSPITTHVLDTSIGKPAEGVRIALELSIGLDDWETLGHGVTNSDGRLPGLLDPNRKIPPGIYRMSFNTGQYFLDRNVITFYPQVQVIFEIQIPTAHYHVPLLLSPWGYSTYRGS